MPLVIVSKIACQRMFQLSDPGVPRTFVEDCRFYTHWNVLVRIDQRHTSGKGERKSSQSNHVCFGATFSLCREFTRSGVRSSTDLTCERKRMSCCRCDSRNCDSRKCVCVRRQVQISLHLVCSRLPTRDLCLYHPDHPLVSKNHITSKRQWLASSVKIPPWR